jgi:hypothetical protein
MRAYENSSMKILVYYGEYKIDEIYNMNDFTVNEFISFYKCLQIIEEDKYKKKERIKKERYIILTDIYFLLFEPLEKKKNFGTLLFWGDIRQLANSRNEEILFEKEKKNILILEWKSGSEVKISFDFIFKDISNKDFEVISLQKIDKLTSKYNMFQDDIWKTDEEHINFNYSNKNYLISLILTKEKLLRTRKNIFLIDELINLYNKIIEILSENGDILYKDYLIKLQNLLNDKECQEEMEDKRI